MQTVWKYILTDSIPQSAFPTHEIVSIKMKQGAKVLSVAMQQGLPCLWVRIPDTQAPSEDFGFLIVGTGVSAPEISDDDRFIGTYMNERQTLVNHVFLLAKR